MRKKPSSFREFQKKAIKSYGKAKESASRGVDIVHSGLQKLDEKSHITEAARKLGNDIATKANELDTRFDVSTKVQNSKNRSKEALASFKSYSEEQIKSNGLDKVWDSASDSVKRNVIDPASDMIHKNGIDQQLYSAGNAVGEAYGACRAWIKLYSPPESAIELLTNTRSELNRIASTLMQTSPSQTDQIATQFGNAVAAKAAGLAAAGVTYTAVAALGTAGTGTAIATLSGAAANSATLAAIGSTVGGGMVAGAMITGGLSILVGLAAYQLLKSEVRPFEALTTEEQNIVQSCWLLMHNIDELLAAGEVKLPLAHAKHDLECSFIPMQEHLKQYCETICDNLDTRHAVRFRREILIDFKRVVIDGYRHYIDQNELIARFDIQSAYVVGGVFYALITRSAVGDDMESQLVLDALRRSSTGLANASESELSNYLYQFDEVQLKGIANNVKGIYHELLYVDHYNRTHEDTYAELHGATNQPGGDILICDSETESVIEYQLKATDNIDYITEHMDRYGDIPVFATEEVAMRMPDVESSGFSNQDITEQVNSDLGAIADNTYFDRVSEAVGISAGLTGGQSLIKMLLGEQEFPDAVMDGLKNVGNASLATALTAYLFG